MHRFLKKSKTLNETGEASTFFALLANYCTTILLVSFYSESTNNYFLIFGTCLFQLKISSLGIFEVTKKNMVLPFFGLLIQLIVWMVLLFATIKSQLEFIVAGIVLVQQLRFEISSSIATRSSIVKVAKLRFAIAVAKISLILIFKIKFETLLLFFLALELFESCFVFGKRDYALSQQFSISQESFLTRLLNSWKNIDILILDYFNFTEFDIFRIFKDSSSIMTKFTTALLNRNIFLIGENNKHEVVRLFYISYINYAVLATISVYFIDLLGSIVILLFGILTVYSDWIRVEDYRSIRSWRNSHLFAIFIISVFVLILYLLRSDYY